MNVSLVQTKAPIFSPVVSHHSFYRFIVHNNPTIWATSLTIRDDQSDGGASFVTRQTDGYLIFSDFESKVVYELNPETLEVKPIVEEDKKIYYADFDVHPVESKWVAAIKEDHHPAKIEDIENTLVVIDSTTKATSTIAKGADFYAFPRFSPDGKQVCWTQWNHPNMPWNYTELWVADWQDGKISNDRVIAGHEAKASVSQPQWSPDGSLFFVDDRTGYWQLYHMTEGSTRHIHVKGLEKAEFASPDWWLGRSV
jgi:Tol biopolymer transport system component